MPTAFQVSPAGSDHQWSSERGGNTKMTEITNNNEWRSKKEIAAHFGIGLRTVTDWMRRRIMPFVKVGGVVRFCVPDCEAAVRKYLVNSRA